MKHDVNVKKYCQQATYCQYLLVGLNKQQPTSSDKYMIIEWQGLKVRNGQYVHMHIFVFFRP